MFMAALFVIDWMEEKRKCLSTDELLNTKKKWAINTYNMMSINYAEWKIQAKLK